MTFVVTKSPFVEERIYCPYILIIASILYFFVYTYILIIACIFFCFEKKPRSSDEDSPCSLYTEYPKQTCIYRMPWQTRSSARLFRVLGSIQRLWIFLCVQFKLLFNLNGIIRIRVKYDWMGALFLSYLILSISC